MDSSKSTETEGAEARPNPTSSRGTDVTTPGQGTLRRRGRALLAWTRAGQIGPGYVDPMHPQPGVRAY